MKDSLTVAQPAPAAPSEPMYLQGYRDALAHAAFYVRDHCQHGEEHAETVLNLKLPLAAPAAQPADSAAPSAPETLTCTCNSYPHTAWCYPLASALHLGAPVSRAAQPADTAWQRSIREDFDLIADAHMHVFGMAHSPAREQALDALKTVLKRNMHRE